MIVAGIPLRYVLTQMLRRHASLILAILLIVLVAAACIVRTGPRRNGPPAYRSAPPAGDHRKGKHKKHKKHKKHLHDAPRGDF